MEKYLDITKKLEFEPLIEKRRTYTDVFGSLDRTRLRLRVLYKGRVIVTISPEGDTQRQAAGFLVSWDSGAFRVLARVDN